MSIALPALHGRHDQRPVPTRDLVIAFAITGTLIFATVATATVGAMARTGSAILDLGLLGLAGRRQQPLPAAVATVVVVITSVLTAPEAIKLPVVAAVALVAYTLARYESGARLVAGFVVCVGGVVVARMSFPEGHAHGVTAVQLVVVVVLLPAVLATLMRVRARLPEERVDAGVLGPDAVFHAVPGVIDGASRRDELSAGPGSTSGRIASWVQFLLTHRDRLLCAVAGGLVLLVPLLDGSDTDTTGRDIVVVGLAVIGVASVGLIGRWPLPALLITLAAAVSFAGVAPLPDTYDSVIGGVVATGLPLIVGLLLRRRPGLFALAACAAAIIVMGLVARAGTLPSAGATTTSSQVLSSLALAVGAWSTGRVLRRGAGVVWIDSATPVGAARALPAYPGARELMQRAELLGLRPTTIRVDQLYDDRLSAQIGGLVRQVLDEALDNAARHAPGTDLAIKVLHEPAVISIEVINSRPLDDAPRSSGPGRGIPELANRVAEVGGMFAVGPASGGFTLRARLPIKNLDDLGRVQDELVDHAEGWVDGHRGGREPSPVNVPAGVDTV